MECCDDPSTCGRTCPALPKPRSFWQRMTDRVVAFLWTNRPAPPPERSVAFTIAIVCLGAKMAKAANDNLAAGSGDADYYKNKLLTGRFYMEKVMPETALRKARIETGADSLMEMAAEAF